MTEQRPLVPQDINEHEAERRRRQEFVRAERARLALGGNLETRDQRMTRRAQEIRALMTREFQRLSYGDSDLEIMPRVLAELLDLIDGMVSVAIHDERERSAKATTKTSDEIRYTEPRWTP